MQRQASEGGAGGPAAVRKSGKLSAAAVPLGAPLRTGGWRLPYMPGAGGKLLRQESQAVPSKQRPIDRRR